MIRLSLLSVYLYILHVYTCLGNYISYQGIQWTSSSLSIMSNEHNLINGVQHCEFCGVERCQCLCNCTVNESRGAYTHWGKVVVFLF